LERPFRASYVTPGLTAALMLALISTGCDYSSGPPPIPSSVTSVKAPETTSTVKGGSNASVSAASPGESTPTGADPQSVEKAAILDNIIKLIQGAALNPGGPAFANAIKNLNQYFEGTKPALYKLDPKARAFLLETLQAKDVDGLESPAFAIQDARHVEDCMLYQGIATRVCGLGDDLTRVRRVFDWMVRQIQLVPPGSLGKPGLGQAYARPYDVLLRGMATESEGIWSERGWLFLSLCRQLGFDGGLITYTPPGVKDPVVWCTAILIDKKPYLFDTRVGLPVPDPKGDGVATLQDVLTDPKILERMDLPGESPYGTTLPALAQSPTKIGVLLDSSIRYFSPRMRLLQTSLAGKNLTVLYRDPAEQRDRFAEALGPHLGKVGLWELPMTVETLLFTDPRFNESSQAALFLFRPEFPLLFARMKELRGETTEAIQDFVAMRFAENPTLMDKKTAMPPEIQDAMTIFATYFLAMCHLDQKNTQQAERFFERTLKMVPVPGRGQPYYNMFRWGAEANLARLRESRGALADAAAYFAQADPTTQHHGNLLCARDVVWHDPMLSPATLPPAPAPRLLSSPTMMPPQSQPQPGMSGAPAQSPIPGTSPLAPGQPFGLPAPDAAAGGSGPPPGSR
jgi:hypothetical protein